MVEAVTVQGIIGPRTYRIEMHPAYASEYQVVRIAPDGSEAVMQKRSRSLADARLWCSWATEAGGDVIEALPAVEAPSCKTLGEEIV